MRIVRSNIRCLYARFTGAQMTHSARHERDAAPEQEVVYILSVTVTRPIRLYDTEDMLADTAAWMVSREAKRELEREVLRALRKLDGDCDVEVLDVQIATEAR